MQDTIFVGMNVHKATISIAVADGARGGEVRHFGNVPNRADHVSKLVERLSKTDGERLRFCYEAGPCGYGLHRQITDLGHECAVVAPSLIPRKAGDRIKTDRRDAVMLAKLHRAGELTAVWVPDAAHQAMRDLIRARTTAVRALGKARQHLQEFLTPRSRTPGRGLGSKYDGPAAKVQLKAEWKRWRTAAIAGAVSLVRQSLRCKSASTGSERSVNSIRLNDLFLASWRG